MKYNYASGNHVKSVTVDIDTFFEEGVFPITAIYKEAAKSLGLDYDDCPGTFRSGEILVAKDVGEKALEISEKMYDKYSAGTAWLMYGPKIQEDLPDGTIAVSDKFYDSES